jgi:hypothetical protein
MLVRVEFTTNTTTATINPGLPTNFKGLHASLLQISQYKLCSNAHRVADQ